MIDREKVINDLQDAVNDDWMWQHADFYALTMQKAIYLLQAQEPVAPDCVDVYTGFDGALERHYLCVACGHEIMKNNRGQTKYCPNCGRAVKWDADD